MADVMTVAVRFADGSEEHYDAEIDEEGGFEFLFPDRIVSAVRVFGMWIPAGDVDHVRFRFTDGGSVGFAEG